MAFFIDSAVGSREFLKPLRRFGIPAQLRQLPCGDFAFWGNGPDGDCRVGIERKRVSEIVEAVRGDKRFKGRQLPKMVKRYKFVFVIVEGLTKIDYEGVLQEGKVVKRGRMAVFYDAGWGVSSSVYDHYQKFMMTCRLKGCVHFIMTADPTETAHCINAIYQWFQKDWNKHSSVFAVEEREPDVALLDERTWTRQVFAQFPGVGWKRSARVAKYFGNVHAGVIAGARDWQQALGFKEGKTVATNIIRYLRGIKHGQGKG